MDSVPGMESPASSISTVSSSRAPRCKTCKLPRKGHPRSGCPKAPTPQDQLKSQGIPATAPPRIGPVTKLRKNVSRSPSFSIVSIQEEPETTDGHVVCLASSRTAAPSPPPTGTGKDTMKTKHPRLVQDSHALLNANSLDLTNFQDRGLDEREVLVAGGRGDVGKWVLTMKKDSTCREQSIALSVDNHRCGNQLHTEAKPYGWLSAFIGGVICGVGVTLIILMYWPDNL